MDEQMQPPSPGHSEADPPEVYEPPALTCLGTVAELTQKTVGGADGSTFNELDIS